MLPSARPSQPQPVADAVNLMVHEAFHFVDQNGEHVCNKDHPHKWKDANAQSRSAGDGDAAYMRNHVLNYLAAATKEAPGSAQRNKMLAQAKIWQRRFEARYPEILKHSRVTDRTEGSANYVGTKAEILSKLGCDTDEASLQKEMLERALMNIGPLNQPVDAQSYAFGQLVGTMLDELGVKNWKSLVESGQTLLEILFAHTNEIKADPEPLAIESLGQMKELSSRLNQCMRGLTVEPVAKALRSPEDYVALVIPHQASIGISLGFHSAPELLKGAEDRIMGGGITLKTDRLDIEGLSAVGTGGHCSTKDLLIVVPKKSFILDGKLPATFDFSTGQGRAKGILEVKPSGKFQGGMDLYCPVN